MPSTGKVALRTAREPRARYRAVRWCVVIAPSKDTLMHHESQLQPENAIWWQASKLPVNGQDARN